MFLLRVIGRPFCLVFFLTLVMFMLGQDVFAATPDFSYFLGNTVIRGMFLSVKHWLNYIATLVIGIGLVVFLWGVVRYITAGPDETKRTEARNLMVWGIIGLFVMVGVWGLVSLIGYIFGITLGGTTSFPSVFVPP